MMNRNRSIIGDMPAMSSSMNSNRGMDSGFSLFDDVGMRGGSGGRIGMGSDSLMSRGGGMGDIMGGGMGSLAMQESLRGGLSRSGMMGSTILDSPLRGSMMDRVGSMMDRGMMDRNMGSMDRGNMDLGGSMLDRGGALDGRGGGMDRGGAMMDRGGLDRMDSRGGMMDRGGMDRGGGMMSMESRASLMDNRGIDRGNQLMDNRGGGMMDSRSGMLDSRGGMMDSRGGMMDSRGGMLDSRGGMLDMRGGMLDSHMLDGGGSLHGMDRGVADMRGVESLMSRPLNSNRLLPDNNDLMRKGMSGRGVGGGDLPRGRDMDRRGAVPGPRGGVSGTAPSFRAQNDQRSRNVPARTRNDMGPQRTNSLNRDPKISSRQMGTNLNNSSEGDRKCFNCGSTGHMQRNCTKNKQVSNSSSSGSSNVARRTTVSAGTTTTPARSPAVSSPRGANTTTNKSIAPRASDKDSTDRKRPSASTDPVVPAKKPTKETKPEVKKGPIDLSKTKTPYFCKSCSIGCQDRAAFEDHVSGKLHESLGGQKVDMATVKERVLCVDCDGYYADVAEHKKTRDHERAAEANKKNASPAVTELNLEDMVTVDSTGFDAEEKDGDKKTTDETPKTVEETGLPPQHGVAIGQEFIVPVSGYFCKLCCKFYSTENAAKVTHCQSKSHYEKLQTFIRTKLGPGKTLASLPITPTAEDKLQTESEQKAASDITTAAENKETKVQETKPASPTKVNGSNAPLRTNKSTTSGPASRGRSPRGRGPRRR